MSTDLGRPRSRFSVRLDIPSFGSHSGALPGMVATKPIWSCSLAVSTGECFTGEFSSRTALVSALHELRWQVDMALQALRTEVTEGDPGPR